MPTDSEGAMERLLTALLSSGSEGATRAQIINSSGIGTTTFYRIIKDLLAKGLVREQGDRFVLPLDVPANFWFKRSYDSKRLFKLPADVLGQVLQTCGDLGRDWLAIWLTGSFAYESANSDSDIDLVVVWREGARPPRQERGARPVQIRSYSEREFVEAVEAGETFVHLVLRHGILIDDNNFAGALYRSRLLDRVRESAPPRDMVHAFRERFLSLLQQNRLEEAREQAESLTVAAARTVLADQGFLPAAKHDLAAAVETLFGSGVADVIRVGLSSELQDRRSGVRWARGLWDWYQNYFQHAPHLREGLQIVTAGLVGFEQVVSGICAELLEGTPWRVGDSRGREDFRFETEVVSILVETKSVKGPAPADLLAKAGTLGCEVVILNARRSLPILERPPIPTELKEKARDRHIHLVDSADLLRLHNRMHVADARREEALATLLPTWRLEAEEASPP